LTTRILGNSSSREKYEKAEGAGLQVKGMINLGLSFMPYRAHWSISTLGKPVRAIPAATKRTTRGACFALLWQVSQLRCTAGCPERAEEDGPATEKSHHQQ